MTITEAYQRRCSLASMGCRHDHWHRPDIARIIRDHALAARLILWANVADDLKEAQE